MSNCKACTKCGQILTIDNFYLRKGKPYSACKKCHNQQVMNWQSKNKDKYNANQRNWRKSNTAKTYAYVSKYRLQNQDKVKNWKKNWDLHNPNKCREYRLVNKKLRFGTKVKLVTSREIRKMLLKPCFYCGESAKHVDHVIPLSRGGWHAIGHLVPACMNCNLSKSTKTVMEWRVWRAKL